MFRFILKIIVAGKVALASFLISWIVLLLFGVDAGIALIIGIIIATMIWLSIVFSKEKKQIIYVKESAEDDQEREGNGCATTVLIIALLIAIIVGIMLYSELRIRNTSNGSLRRYTGGTEVTEGYQDGKQRKSDAQG